MQSATAHDDQPTEPVKSASRRRKALRPWSLSARAERLDELSSIEKTWPKQFVHLEEILPLYRLEMEGSIQCLRCGFLADSEDFLDHLTDHYPYKCCSCGFSCDSSFDLDEHYRSQSCASIRPNLTTTTPITTEKSSKLKIHRCRHCSFISHNKEDYWTHHRIHIRAEKILECPNCPFVTEYKHHLEYHLRNHLGSKPFKCSKCDYSCVNLSMLRSHQKSHYRHLIFKCSNCSFESKTYSLIEEHLQLEGHQLDHDEQIEEFLQEYSTNNPTKKTSSSRRKSKKSATNKSLIKKLISLQQQTSSSSADSSIDEQPTMTFNCQFCHYIAESKENLHLHLFQHSYDPNVDSIRQWMEFFQSNEQCINLDETSDHCLESPSHSSLDQQTQVDEWQIQRLFECFPCQMIFKDFAMYCTHKQFHYSATNPFRCAQCGEQKENQYDFFVHITQQAHDLT